jgi:predicted nucleic acid-binding protein
MVVADTSVWVEHLRRSEPRLAALLKAGDVLCHPFVVGELACGHLRRREEILGLLSALPSVDAAAHVEVLAFIERHRLQGKGLGLVDMHLLASCALAGRPLWTLDLRLAGAAARLGLTLD